MNEELKGFKYLFDESKINKINDHGSFYRAPSRVQAKDWHRKLVTLYSNDIEEIDMMDEIFLNPKFANPYISCMYICILGEKIRHDYASVWQDFRTRAYRSMLDHARVCGELGTRYMVSDVACTLFDEEGYKPNAFNPFERDADAIIAAEEIVITMQRCLNIRKKNKDDIVRYFHEKQVELKETQEKAK